MESDVRPLELKMVPIEDKSYLVDESVELLKYYFLSIFYFLRLSRISRSNTTSSGVGGAAGSGGASMIRILLTILII